MNNKYNFSDIDVHDCWLDGWSQGLSWEHVKFALLGCRPLAVTPHCSSELAELQFLRMKGNKRLKPNSTRVCLSAIVDIFICPMSKAETQWEIRTSQPKLTARSQAVKSSAPTAYNTQMDCPIRFRGIGYYTLGLLFPTQPSAWQDWVWQLSCLVLLAFEFLDKENKCLRWWDTWKFSNKLEISIRRNAGFLRYYKQSFFVREASTL